MLPDITGFARRLEEGQCELTARLDRIIELLERLAHSADGLALVRPVDSKTATG